MNLMVLPLWAWIVFYVLVFFMLVADLKMFGKKGQHEVKVGEALKMTAVWIGVSLLFCAGIYFFYPGDSHEMALEFLAGYLIEKSLSMDNLFVFLMLFSFFGIERKYQHEVLFWGIFRGIGSSQYLYLCRCCHGGALRVGAGTLRTVPALYGRQDVCP